MDWLDQDTLLYIGIIILFLVFFLWNNRRLKRNREQQRERNFRKRYHERKNKDKRR